MDRPTYDQIEQEVRELAMSLPPSDFGSTRVIQAVASYVHLKLRGATVGPFIPFEEKLRKANVR